MLYLRAEPDILETITGIPAKFHARMMDSYRLLTLSSLAKKDWKEFDLSKKKVVEDMNIYFGKFLGNPDEGLFTTFPYFSHYGFDSVDETFNKKFVKKILLKQKEAYAATDEAAQQSLNSVLVALQNGATIGLAWA